jgi:hypothetical protein
MDVVFGVAFLWVVPLFVAYAIGKPKNRSGFLYGFFLGWLGVLGVAVLPVRPGIGMGGPDDLEMRRGTVMPKFYEQTKAELMSERIYRECPFCKELMRREASVCPHCRHESEPWKPLEGKWWVQMDGDWHWLDEATGAWTRLEKPATAAVAALGAMPARHSR